jgi:hypothetical protein
MTSEKSTEHLWHNGTYFGYPHCCIDAFIDIYKKVTKRTDEQEKVHVWTGFVPCHTHALEILAGRTSLEGLILPSRKHPKPFTVYRENPKSRVTKQQ